MGGSTSRVGWKPSGWNIRGKIMNNSHDKLTQFYADNIIHQTPDNKKETGVPDTGSTGNYLKSDAPHSPSTNMGPPIYLVLPNSQTVQSSKPHLLDFPSLNYESCAVHILPNLTYSLLVSIGKICDCGCTNVFKEQQVTIKHNNKIFIQVPRDRRNGWWNSPLTYQPSVSPTTPQE